MVAGSTTLQEAFPRMTIKAVVGEQVDGGATILAENKEAVEKADAVLIGLGTNGTLTVGNTNYVEKLWKKLVINRSSGLIIKCHARGKAITMNN